MDTRDYVIVGVLVGLIVWFFCGRRRSSCGCNTPAPSRLIGNQGSTVSSGGCGPFACGGSVRDNMTAPLAQPLRRI